MMITNLHSYHLILFVLLIIFIIKLVKANLIKVIIVKIYDQVFLSNKKTMLKVW